MGSIINDAPKGTFFWGNVLHNISLRLVHLLLLTHCLTPKSMLYNAFQTVGHPNSAPPSNTWFPWPTTLSVPNCISISSAVFAQLTTESPCSLQWATPFLPRSKLPFCVGDLDPMFPWPAQVHVPNDTSIGSAIFAGLTIVTDGPRYSICSNRRISIVLRCCLNMSSVETKYAMHMARLLWQPWFAKCLHRTVRRCL